MKKLLRFMLLILVSGVLLLLYLRFTSDKEGEGLGVSKVLEEDSYKGEKLVNILLLGLDRRSPEDSSRSDSMIIVTVDRENKKIKVASIMRDSYVPIPGHGSNKINAAYTYGGPLHSIETVNKNFGLDIRDFVSADFVGFEKLIDILGGVSIDVKAKEVSYCGVQRPGPQVLNGKQALAYSRLRKVGNSDFERTQRQRRVLNEIYKKLKAMKPEELGPAVKTLLSTVETSLNFREILAIASDAAKFDLDKIEEFRVPVSGYFSNEVVNGSSSLVLDMEENRRRLKEFIYGEAGM